MKNSILRESLSTFMHSITSQPLTLPILNNLTISQDQIELSKEVCDNIVRCRAYLDEKMKYSNTPIYGINTGFGSLCYVQISMDQLTQLQENLVR